MDRSIFRIKRTKTLHQDWKHKKSAELEKQRRDFLEEKRKLEEDRRNFEREKREFSTHCQLEKDSMKREKQLFETCLLYTSAKEEKKVIVEIMQ